MERERGFLPAPATPAAHRPAGTPAGANGIARRSSRSITVPGVGSVPSESDIHLAVGSGLEPVAGHGPPPPPQILPTPPGMPPPQIVPQPQPQILPTPAEIAAQEQAALWRSQRTRAWHDRTWLRVLMVIAAATGLTAIIPYPLRITSECTIIPIERAKVRSELAGVLAEILVDEGSAVKKGDVIARIDDRALKAERQRALAEIAKIEAELATLRQGHRREELKQQAAVLGARRAEVTFAGKEARRRTQMAREGVGSSQAADAANRELETRRQAMVEAQAALKLLQAGTRPEEIAAHEAMLHRAQSELAYVDERLAMTVVKAPIDGEILTPRFKERIHEGVEAGAMICEIANLRRMRAEVLVPEREVDAIALGMPTLVKVESYPTHPFEGKVGFIAPAVDGDDKRVRVSVELENGAGLLKSNMTGYGEVEAGKRSVLHLATRRLLRWIRVRYLL
jgi:multidrug efflux pump subunit AcrA (membrane-fusion protein)